MRIRHGVHEVAVHPICVGAAVAASNPSILGAGYRSWWRTCTIVRCTAVEGAAATRPANTRPEPGSCDARHYPPSPERYAEPPEADRCPRPAGWLWIRSADNS